MFIVAGLGNPGIAYQKSRHNAGYQALDALACKLSVRVTKHGFSGVYGEGVRNGERIVLIKPETFMNLSGDCVRRVTDYFKCPPERLLVIYDDIELPVGSLRIRASGGAGTHNGMRSVVSCMGLEGFPRIRIGVGDRAQGELKDYVLGKPGKEQQERLEDAFASAAEAAVLIIDGRISDAQALYNKKHEGGAEKNPSA